MSTNNQEGVLGEELNTTKMPGHWLLARLGKRVLRPGGRELTQQMLNGLCIKSSDEVVEFAPGLGFTAQLTLEQKPTSYTAVERDEAAADVVRRYLTGNNQTCLIGRAEKTGTTRRNSLSCLRRSHVDDADTKKKAADCARGISVDETYRALWDS